MKHFLIALVFLFEILFFEISFSQPSAEIPVGQIWVKCFSGNHEHNGDAARAIAVDPQGNAYVCGYMYLLNMGYSNAVVVKYSKHGDSSWSAVQSPGSEFFDIVVDSQGNSYVTGSGTGTGGSGFLTIKYNASGVQQWAKIYNGFGTNNHKAYDIELDSLGNVYVTGESTGPGSRQDIATVKYNPSGDTLWVKRRTVTIYGGGVFIGVDSSRNVYVSTTIQIDSKTGADFLTIKYNEAGVPQWERIYGGGKFSDEYPSTMCVDGTGNVYVSGAGITIKYNSLGDSIWFQTLPQGEGLSSSVVDGAGDLIVAGNIFDGQRRFTVAKYSSGGALLWQNNYSGASGANDLAVDIAGNCYATGNIYPKFQFDALTIKYDPMGNIQFVQRYNGPAGTTDGASSIAISGEEVYIAGTCTNIGGTNSDFLTVKYSNDRTIQPGPIGYIVHESNITEDNNSGSEMKNEVSKINSVISGSVPTECEMSQNFPNPFNPVTSLEFGISDLGFVSLKIYDITGKEVAELVNEILNPGRYRYTFDASALPSGIYFYTLRANGFTETKKMNLIK